MGDVLVGNTRSRLFEFVNTGGDGCFFLLGAAQWATALHQHTASRGSSMPAMADNIADQHTPITLPMQQPRGQCTLKSSPARAKVAEAVWQHSVAAAQVDTDSLDPGHVLQGSAATSGAFSISPAYLDLPAGAAAFLSVTFSPTFAGPHVDDFVMVCDNCTAHPLRVEGSGAEVQVRLVGIDDRQWLHQDARLPLWLGKVSKCERDC